MSMNRAELRSTVRSTIIDVMGIPPSNVFKYMPKKLDGMSPVITIEVGRSSPSHTPAEPSWPGLLIGLWILREDAEEAEDELDTLSDNFIDAITDRYNVQWDNFTEPDYLIIDGNHYRVEWHSMLFEWF